MAKIAAPTEAPAEVYITEQPTHTGPGLPTLPPCDKFRLAAHPKRWMVSLTAGRVVPDLVHLPLTNGVCGVSDRGSTKDQDDQYERAGWTIIPWGHVPPKSEHKSYVKAVPVRGGLAHVMSYATLIPGTDQAEIDQDGHDAFLCHLVDSGLVAPPAGYALDRLQDRIEEALGRAQQNADKDPRAKRAADRCREQLDIIERTRAGKGGKPATKKAADA